VGVGSKAEKVKNRKKNNKKWVFQKYFLFDFETINGFEQEFFISRCQDGKIFKGNEY